MPHNYGGCWMSKRIAYTVFDAKIVFFENLHVLLNGENHKSLW